MPTLKYIEGESKSSVEIPVNAFYIYTLFCKLNVSSTGILYYSVDY
jgi:hypothetical protein